MKTIKNEIFHSFLKSNLLHLAFEIQFITFTCNDFLYFLNL